MLHNELMIGCLWAGRTDCGIDIVELMRMLGRMLWPLIRKHCLVHDKYYRLDGVKSVSCPIPRVTSARASSPPLATTSVKLLRILLCLILIAILPKAKSIARLKTHCSQTTRKSRDSAGAVTPAHLQPEWTMKSF